jgi:glutamate dehydrogenase (NAD(P)+)
VVAATDVNGGVFNDKGLDVPGLLRHAAERRPLAEWRGGRSISNDELWSIPCEWLVPAALGGVITREGNARTVDCRVVVGPRTAHHADADIILAERGIAVPPDFANAGGVTVSYLSGPRTCSSTVGPTSASTASSRTRSPARTRRSATWRRRRGRRSAPRRTPSPSSAWRKRSGCEGPRSTGRGKGERRRRRQDQGVAAVRPRAYSAS